MPNELNKVMFCHRFYGLSLVWHYDDPWKSYFGRVFYICYKLDGSLFILKRLQTNEKYQERITHVSLQMIPILSIYYQGTL